ncbi:hypothetical protein SC1083_1414 [Aggregatibacter actinomycetemcomitans serotype e str. SC1083]|uniref:Uncharacterized protein n=1 Tax=Aggregatibacter actinomycetemcomitans serotype e str. SC1083 TaxID=907488 RepID=G4A9A4_AGGAC|nr:hypothetical protein SC1083_1414 [Aggregatibacter actinomycetemcomitans serotype e str. SC1083]
MQVAQAVQMGTPLEHGKKCGWFSYCFLGDYFKHAPKFNRT